ncbi:hypothetical protein AGLY_016486 [Aphis glycines]|uniref:THAP-type domain-containing protein n=1 Tax=Aphis glycines TaxID=307491 RepID=A0A6G0SY91_APHGL|nr:hypothetical protein AGLY_016486 [Aphis glycines]
MVCNLIVFQTHVIFWQTKKWVYIIDADLHNVDANEVYLKKRVCSVYFSENNRSPGTNRLKCNVIPTLNFPVILSNPDTPKATVVAIPSVDLDLCGKCPDDNVVSSPNTNVQKAIVKPSIDLDLSGVQELNGDLINLIGDASDANNLSLHAMSINDNDIKSKSVDAIKNANRSIIVSKKQHRHSGFLKNIYVRRVVDLTPKCRHLYKNALYFQRQMTNANVKKAIFKDRLTAATKFSNVFDVKISNKMTVAGLLFTRLQLHETKKEKHGRRFTGDKKMLSLSLYKCSPQCYRLLSKLFTLPSLKTLSNLLSNVPITTGINPIAMKVLKSYVEKLPPSQKYFSLLFDEMSISADHALVFMVRGITKKYKQPIAYFFCQESTNSHILSKIIIDVICEVYSTGLHNKEYRYDIYEIQRNNKYFQIIHLFDAPHLLKGIQNNLLTKNLIFTIDNITYEAYWQHIIDLYRKDSEMENLKMLPRLTNNHVIPQKFSKMKVKREAQIFSQQVSSLMAFLASQKIIDVDARGTENLCLFFDQLFDSVNGSYNKIVDSKKYRTAITTKSNHFDLWEKSLPALHSMAFIDSKSQKRQRPPTVKNWEKTIRGLKAIFTFLHSKGIKSVLPRNLNQDSLKNCFGSLRM